MKRPTWLLILCTFTTGMGVVYLDVLGKSARVIAAAWHLYGLTPFICAALLVIICHECATDGGRA